MRLNCHAMLATLLTLAGPGAYAAAGFELVSTRGEMESQASVLLGPLGDQRKFVNDWNLVPVSGVPLTQTNHLDWSLEDEPPPLGTGQRSTGAFHTDMQMVYTLTSPAPDQRTISSSALATSSATWVLQAADGSFVEGSTGLNYPHATMELEFRLNRPADLRLAGRLWTTTSQSMSVFILSGQRDDGTTVTVEQATAQAGQATDILAQAALKPGNYTLVTSMYDPALLDCCNLNYGGSMGWDYTLELSAAPVPEPSVHALLLAGLAGLAWRRRGGPRPEPVGGEEA